MMRRWSRIVVYAILLLVLPKNVEIPFQYTVITGGGTDAGAQHQSLDGIPSFAITVPVRYLHSHTSMIHEDDYLNAVKLVTEIVKRLDAETVEQIRENV